MTHDHSHSHDHSHGHEGHSHSRHTHSHAHSHTHNHGDQPSEMDLKDKLRHLLTHWVDHNNSHKDTYLSWAKKAEAEALSDVARHLEAADAASAKITAHLEKALASLDAPPSKAS